MNTVVLKEPTVFLPSGGPYTPFLRLSSLDMMMSWVCLAVVWAEKLISSGLYLSGSFLSRKFYKNKREKDQQSVKASQTIVLEKHN